MYISIWSIESGEFRSAKEKNIVSPTLYGFRGDAPHIIVCMDGVGVFRNMFENSTFYNSVLFLEVKAS